MKDDYLIRRAQRFIRVREMRDSGAKWKDIAKELGVSVPRVSVMYMYGDNDIPESIKDSVRFAYKHRCALCGSAREEHQNLDVHHIDPSRGHTVENLVALCRRCHRFVHKTKKDDVSAYLVLMKKASRENGKKGGKTKESGRS